MYCAYEYIYDRASKRFCMPSLAELIRAKRFSERDYDTGIVWCISLLRGITNQFGGDTRISSLDGTKYHREKVRYQDSSAT